ncbi:MAG: molybdopterin molybdotransferase MoeA [Epsilonproteobacteria bacterium]|nr:molybdopterin molybdenumtransferase MoeA [Campylobacterota bacterium]NPA56776.1 molybdopterin molybdotransferase MoeA [Campylobacterota bacterium]
MAILLMEALRIIERVPIPKRSEILPLEEALNRVAATTYTARHNLPNFDNSAMDGYAVTLEDRGKRVQVAATLLAGESREVQVQKGVAVKVMTGSKLPKGCEAVVPIEDVEYHGEQIVLPKEIRAGANMRLAGEDIEIGESLVEEGDTLTPFKLSLLASQGYSYIRVYRRPQVVLFATGSELKMHYERLESSSIYNSNTPSLLTRLRELGADVHFLHTPTDDLETIKETIKEGLESDLIITTGGVSVGDADHTKEAFKELGMEIFFSKIEIKPGKPTTFGQIGRSYILNLPGNPLAAQLNFEIFGRFLINRLKGSNRPYHRPIRALLQGKIQNRPGRDTVIPGHFDGLYFHPIERRAPGMVSTMARANGFIIVDREVKELKREVSFIPLWEFSSGKMEEIISR